MTNLLDRLEEIASKSTAREVYNQYLFLLKDHMGVIELVNYNCTDIRAVKLLAECYAVASIASNGDAKDQVMYDILREVAYQTAISKDHVIDNIDALSFTLMNALPFVKKEWKDSKNKTKLKS